jgi:Ca2+-transporting ATPase
MWGYAIVLGFISIPVGIIIRLIPDRLIERLVPDYLKRRANSKIPGLTVSDDEERFDSYPTPLADIRDELTFLKRVKGGRVNNLKFAMRHPRETFMPKYKSPSGSREHSRANSISVRVPQTPTRGDSFGSISNVPTPDSRKRSRSNRSRSNSALGAVTVMTGIVAGSIAAGWSPIDRRGEPDFGQLPKSTSQESQSDSSQPNKTVLGEDALTDEPVEVSEGFTSDSALDVPMLNMPKTPAERKSNP